MEQPKAPWRSGICQNKVSTPTLPEGPERYGSNLILPQISQTAEKDSIREQKSGAQFNRSRSRDSSTVPLPASSIAALLQSAMSCGAAHRNIPDEGVSRAIRPNVVQPPIRSTAATVIVPASSKAIRHSFAGWRKRFWANTDGHSIPVLDGLAGNSCFRLMIFPVPRPYITC